MAEGKNIQIRIAATGADQAAAEVRKVEQAVSGVGSASADSAPGIDDLKEQLAALRKEAEALTETTDETSESASDLDENVGKIARVQKAQAVAQLAGNVGALGTKFLEVAGRVETFDAELASTLTNAGKGLQNLGSSLNSVALGFAVGGPVGAAAAALVVAVQSIGDAWITAKTAAAEAAQAQINAMADAADATRDAGQAAAERNTALTAAAVEAGIEAQNRKLKDQAEQLKESVRAARELRDLQNEALDANDRAGLADLDLAESRGDITPADARSRRRDIEDAATQRDREERRRRAREDAIVAGRDAVQKTAAAAAAAQAAQEAEAARQQAEQEAIKTGERSRSGTAGEDSFLVSNKTYQKAYDAYTATRDRGDDDEIQAARKQLNALKIELVKQAVAEAALAMEELKEKSGVANSTSANAAELADAAAAARRNAAAKTTTADRTDATINTVNAADARARQAREQAEARRAFDAAKKKSEQEAEREQRKKEAEEKRRQAAEQRADSDAAGFGRSAVSLIPKGATDKARAAIETAAARLQDGAQGQELQELLSLVESMAGYIERAEGKNNANAIKIRNLSERIRRVEGK